MVRISLKKVMQYAKQTGAIVIDAKAPAAKNGLTVVDGKTIQKEFEQLQAYVRNELNTARLEAAPAKEK